MNEEISQQVKDDRKYLDGFWRRFNTENPFALDGDDFGRLGDIAERYIPLKSEEDLDEL